MIHLVFFIVLASGEYFFTGITPKGVSGINLIPLSDNENFLSFSGKTSSLTFESSLREYSLKYNQTKYFYYVSLRKSEKLPSPRSLYGVSKHSESLAYIFGGQGSNGALGDLWKYYINDNKWEQVECSIPARFDYAFTTIQKDDHSIFAILGGSKNYYELTSDFYFIETYKNESINIVKMPSPYHNCSFESISGAQLQYFENALYLFSGSITRNSTHEYFQDLCVFDMEKNYWIMYDLQQKLINSAQGGSFIFKNKLYYFFGRKDEKFNEFVYILNLTDLNAGWVIIDYEYFSDDCYRSQFGTIMFENFDEEDNKILLFYGGTNKNGYLNSLGYIYYYPYSDNIEIYCLDSKSNPGFRFKSTLSHVSNQLYLFGGVQNGEYFNDLWSYKCKNCESLYDYLLDHYWKNEIIYGELPPKRFSHSAASQGSFLLISGGYSEDLTILPDYWLLDASGSNKKWIEIHPSSSQKPPLARINSCTILDLPYFYIIGGETSEKLLFDIWRYDFSDNTFEEGKIKSKQKGLSRHGCFLDKIDDEIFIYTIFGSLDKSNIPSNNLLKLNITDFNNINITVITNDSIMIGRSDFAYTAYRSKIYIFGGQRFFKESLLDFISIDLEEDTFSYSEIETQYSNTIKVNGLHSMAFSSIKEMMIIYSGSSDNGNQIDVPSSELLFFMPLTNKTCLIPKCIEGSENRYYGDYEYYYAYYKVCWDCECGYYKSKYEEKCQICPNGTFTYDKGSTHISQCLPESSLVSSKCKICNNSETCEIKYDIQNDEKHPNLLKQRNNTFFLLILVFTCGGCLIIFVIFWFLFVKLRVRLTINDFFRKHHLRPPRLKNPEILPKPRREFFYIGGFFTGFVIFLFLAILTYFIYMYIKGNTTESITLVPSNTLTEKFDSKDGELQINLKIYDLKILEPENCKFSNKSSSGLIIDYYEKITDDYDDDYNSLSKLFKVNKKSIIETGDFIEMIFECPSAFASYLHVSVESDSAYNNEKSRESSEIILENQEVFKGEVPSIFQFELIPALFQDFSLTKESDSYGYRVSEATSPKKGSISNPARSVLFRELKIRVVFMISQSGVYITRLMKIDTLGYIGITLSAISGAIWTLAAIMKIIEFFYNKIKNRKKEVISNYKEEVDRALKMNEDNKKGKNDEKKGEINPDDLDSPGVNQDLKSNLSSRYSIVFN